MPAAPFIYCAVRAANAAASLLLAAIVSSARSKTPLRSLSISPGTASRASVDRVGQPLRQSVPTTTACNAEEDAMAAILVLR